MGIRYSVKVFYLYFHLATLTYSPKSYGLLITFSLIMVDSPMLLLLHPHPQSQSQSLDNKIVLEIEMKMGLKTIIEIENLYLPPFT